jgi:hypothetical protein
MFPWACNAASLGPFKNASASLSFVCACETAAELSIWPLASKAPNDRQECDSETDERRLADHRALAVARW